MSRGYFAGVVWGTVLSGAGLGALSLSVGLPQGQPDQMSAAVMVEDQVLGEEGASDAVVAEPAPDAAPAAPEVSENMPTVAPEVAGLPQAPGGSVPAETQTEIANQPEGPQVVMTAPMQPNAPTAEAAPEISTQPAEAPQPAPVSQPEPQPVPAEPEPVDTPPVRAAVAEPAAEPGRPSIGKPAGSLLDRSAVPEGRLPSIGGAQSNTAQTTQEEARPTTPVFAFAAAPDPDLSPELPKMAVILIDEGQGPLGPETMGEIPFPVSFALSTSHPDPSAAARAYRAQGFEVVALSNLPVGAQPSDVEVNFSSTLAAIPEVVGLLEAPESGLQDSRQVIAQATAYLAQTGHGLITQTKGLNTAQKLAVKEGVPAATVFRDIDGEGQDNSMIRRTLENAAFRARQDGEVVMMGRLNADTLTALLLWGVQDRSDKIALVPVSVLLQQSVAER